MIVPFRGQNRGTLGDAGVNFDPQVELVPVEALKYSWGVPVREFMLALWLAFPRINTRTYDLIRHQQEAALTVPSF